LYLIFLHGIRIKKKSPLVLTNHKLVLVMNSVQTLWLGDLF